MAGKSFIFRFAEVEVREKEFSIVKAGEVLAVEPKAFRVLLVLLRSQGKLIGKEELLNAVWGDAAVTDNSLARSIALLRRLLGDEARSPRFIETVSTVGYRFICPVEVAEDLSASPSAEDRQSDGNESAAAGVLPSTAGERGKRLGWLVVGAAVVLALAAAGVWYLRRSLPPPRITAYTQLTHDGLDKVVVGTDGSRLYLVLADFSYPIGEVAVTGGATTRIPIPIKDIVGFRDVSPDGSSFLILSSEKGTAKSDVSLWLFRVPEGALRRLPDAVSANFSPDGQSVVYSKVEGGIWLVQTNGTNPRKLVALDGQAGPFAWSPDGRVIRFTWGNRLWEIYADGSNLHEVLPGWRVSSGQGFGRWTPDGRFFLFMDYSLDSPRPSELWALDERSSLIPRPRHEPVQLTTGPIHWYGPVPGKDGMTIFADGRTPRGELSRFDVSTGQFDTFLGGISAEGITFSKDGRFVAYVSWPDGILWRANRDGSNPMQLSDPPIRALNPRWSPDGAQIVFYDLSSSESYLVPAAGGSPQRLLPEDKGPQGDPNWSADGAKIVMCGAGADPNSDLRILDLATRQISIVPGSEGTYSPRWSPDGRYIAALRYDSLRLKIFDIAAQKWSEIPTKGNVGWPAWSKDNQSVYFYLNHQDENGVFRARIKGGEPERIADLSNLHRTGTWGWMGLDPTDAPLLLRDISGDDIYALTLEAK